MAKRMVLLSVGQLRHFKRKITQNHHSSQSKMRSSAHVQTCWFTPQESQGFLVKSSIHFGASLVHFPLRHAETPCLWPQVLLYRGISPWHAIRSLLHDRFGPCPLLQSYCQMLVTRANLFRVARPRTPQSPHLKMLISISNYSRFKHWIPAISRDVWKPWFFSICYILLSRFTTTTMYLWSFFVQVVS